MGNWFKNLAIGLVIAFALVFTFNMFSQPQIVDNRTLSPNQQNAYDEQLKKSTEQFEQAKKLSEQAENLQQRQEKVIEKWEEQAKRVDAILTRIENSQK